MEKAHRVTQLVYGNGEFNVDGLNNFVKEVKLAGPGVSSYVVVAIMGPQSSGKSTLLNNLFQTKFREMDAQIGRWCHEIGREQAASKPLLRTIFQAMMRIFGHNRKTTLLFVLRDKSKTPVEKLKAVILEDIEKIWDEAPKRAAHKYTLLDQIFRVEVVALSSYEREEEKFKEEVAEIRSQFFGSTDGDRKGDVPASAFSLHAQNVWQEIKNDRDLDLPAQKVMLANFRCEEILNDKLNKLGNDKGWLQLKEAAETGLVPGLGEKLSNILDFYLLQYESETMDYDETVRTSKREVLKSKVLDEKSREQINKIVHMNEANQKAAQAQIDKLVKLHAKDQEQLNMLVESHAKDRREAQEQYNRLQASMANYLATVPAQQQPPATPASIIAGTTISAVQTAVEVANFVASMVNRYENNN